MKMLKMSLDLLSKIQIAPVANGAVIGSSFDAGMLWSQTPAAIFVIRRPG